MNDEAETKKRPLTAKQQAFISAYLTNGFNATQAAITAGYKGKPNVIGAQNLAKLNISQPVKKELDALRTHALFTKEGRAKLLSEMADTIEKQLKANQFLEITETFDKARVEAMRGILDDIAKEFGDRKQTNDTKHSGGVEISFAWKKAEK